MKIAFIADIHGNAPALSVVLDHIEQQGALLAFAGDLLDYGAEPEQCAEMLLNSKWFYCDNFILKFGVLGNHDLALLNNDCSRFRTEHGKKSFKWSYEYLHNSKDLQFFISETFCCKWNNILISHGTDIDPWYNLFETDTKMMDKMIKRNPDIEIFITAHTHLQFYKEYKGKIFVNPGSVGQSRNGIPKAHYCIYDTNTEEFEFYSLDYPIEAAAKEIEKVPELDNFLATRLYLGI